MGIIRALLRLSLFFWVIGIGGFLYYKYMTWQTESLVPLQQQLETAKQQLTRLQKQNRDAETFEKERDARFQELQTLAEQFNQALEKLPRSADTPGLLSNLAEISDRVGVEFTKFEPQPAQSTGFLMENPFKIELKGTFVQIMSFLDEVAHLKRIVTSRSLSLAEPVLRGQTAILKADTTLVTYYFDESGKAAARAQPATSANSGAATSSSSSAEASSAPKAADDDALEGKKGK
jgi:type IV pilus assembly protein PilO